MATEALKNVLDLGGFFFYCVYITAGLESVIYTLSVEAYEEYSSSPETLMSVTQCALTPFKLRLAV